MCESTGRRRDAASVIFDLPGYRVIGAVDLPLNGCRVIVKADQVADGCLACGWFPGGPMYGSVSESQTSPVPGVSSSWSSPGWCVRNRPAHGAPSLRPPPSSTGRSRHAGSQSTRYGNRYSSLEHQSRHPANRQVPPVVVSNSGTIQLPHLVRGRSGSSRTPALRFLASSRRCLVYVSRAARGPRHAVAAAWSPVRPYVSS